MNKKEIKNGVIQFLPNRDGLLWTIAFEIPGCKLYKKSRWLFGETRRIPFIDSEVETYYHAVRMMRDKMNEWLRILEKAVKYEKQ